MPNSEDVLDMHRLLLAIGSNVNHTKNVALSKQFLSERFERIQFSKELYTDPLGDAISGNKYVNLLAVCLTDLSCDRVIATLKQIERACGDTCTLRKEGKVVMDIDLLEYDTQRYHIADWQRQYIIELMKSFKQIISEY